MTHPDNGTSRETTRLGWFRTANGNARRLGFWRYWMGRWHLRHGFCPLCNSSPPQRYCPVCQGSTSYGPGIGSTRRANWRKRFEALRAETL